MKHRDLQARQVANRIDYVDLRAFGVGIEIDNEDYYRENSKLLEQSIQNFCHDGRLTTKLERFNIVLDNLKKHLCRMAVRYDRRINLIFENKCFDMNYFEVLQNLYADELQKQKEIMIVESIDTIRSKSEPKRPSIN